MLRPAAIPPASGYIEPSDGTTGNDVTFFGDSITYGEGASPRLTNRWTSLLSAAKGYTEDNQGFSGWTLCPNACTSSLDINSIPAKTNDRRFIFIAAGNNDIQIASLEPSDYADRIADWIAMAVSLGWNPMRVIVISNFYAEFTHGYFEPCDNDFTQARRTAFRDAMQSAALSNGGFFINCYDPMLEGGGMALLNDVIHPNNAGHALIANTIGNIIP